jgi:hypothetical protein
MVLFAEDGYSVLIFHLENNPYQFIRTLSPCSPCWQTYDQRELLVAIVVFVKDVIRCYQGLPVLPHSRYGGSMIGTRRIKYANQAPVSTNTAINLFRIDSDHGPDYSPEALY